MDLTKEEFNDELMYLTSKLIIKELLDNHLINNDEYHTIKEALLDYYKPLVSGLMEGKIWK